MGNKSIFKNVKKKDEKEKKVSNKTSKVAVVVLSYLLCTAVILAILAITCQKIMINKQKPYDPEIARAMTYDTFEPEDENLTETDNIKFGAFFARDLDGDGNAEKIKGSCNSITANDTLYMNLNVQSEGYLKDASIYINGVNFKLSTNLKEDSIIDGNYINADTTRIDFKDIKAGTQRLLTGFITPRISDISSYSRSDNTVTLRGTYVKDDGTEISIRKVVNLTADWHVKVSARFTETWQEKTDIIRHKDTNEGEISFYAKVENSYENVRLKKLHVEGTLPKISGYAPTRFELINTKDKLIEYDEENGTFIVEREEGVSKISTVSFKVYYPLEAFPEQISDTFTATFPVQAYFEAHNNPNEEFENPLKSNVANTQITVAIRGQVVNGDIRFTSQIGEEIKRYESNGYVYLRQEITKQNATNIYNKKGEPKNTTYPLEVTAEVRTVNAYGEHIVISENADYGCDKLQDSSGNYHDMSEFLKTTSIVVDYGLDDVLGENGTIDIVNVEDGTVCATLTENLQVWKNVDNINNVLLRTSEVIDRGFLHITVNKEIDNEKLTEVFSTEEHEELQRIYSYNRFGTQSYDETDGVWKYKLSISDIDWANYVNERSGVTIAAKPDTVSTEQTEQELNLTIVNKANYSLYNQSNWLDGKYIIEFPKEFLKVELIDLISTDRNLKITGYDMYEVDGKTILKIYTEGETALGSKAISIDVKAIVDIRTMTTSSSVKIYAYNDMCDNYITGAKDIYDVDGDGNLEEYIGYSNDLILFSAPKTMVTTEILTTTTEEGKDIKIAPQVGIVDKLVSKEAQVGIIVLNSYDYSVEGLNIHGVFPFVGNKTPLTDKDLNSTYTPIIKGGIQVPEEIKESVTVYYSENEVTNNDLADESNGWKEEADITDWKSVRSYLIVFAEDMPVNRGDNFEFTYDIEVPDDVEYNDISYTTHAVGYNVNTTDGKLYLETEAPKLGIMIAKRFDLILSKYKEGIEEKISGVTISLTEEGQEEKRTQVTNDKGEITFTDLYVGKIYTVKEESTLPEYLLNDTPVKFRTYLDENNEVQVEVLEGSFDKGPVLDKVRSRRVVRAGLENTPKYILNITKYNEDRTVTVPEVTYLVTGKGYEAGIEIITDGNGIAILRNLYPNEVYTLKEISAKGYFIDEEEKQFKVINNEGIISLEMISGEFADVKVIQSEIGAMPTLEVILEDVKIPTFDLQIVKYDKGSNNVLKGAVYQIKGAALPEVGESYKTNDKGIINIRDLRLSSAEEENIYILKEIVAPDGYTLSEEEIKFKAYKDEVGNVQIEVLEGTLREEPQIDGELITLKLEDTLLFKLIKKDQLTDKPLPNAKFAIYEVIMEGEEEVGLAEAKDLSGNAVGDLETINGTEYRVIKTDSKGEITVPLRMGYYKVIEVETPEGYILPEDEADRTYYFTIAKQEIGTKEYVEQYVVPAGSNSIRVMEATKDGGVLIPTSKATNEFKLMKYNNRMVKNWETSISDYYTVVHELENGDIILVSEKKVAKVGSDGKSIEEYNLEKAIYPDSYGLVKVRVSETGDLVGLNEDSLTGKTSLCKFNLKGEIIWSTVVESANASECSMSIVDDGYVVVEKVVEMGLILHKYDENGNFLWQKEYEYMPYDESFIDSKSIDWSVGPIVLPSEDNGIVVAFGASVYLQNWYHENKGVVVKFDENGNAVWGIKMPGASSQIYGMSKLEDGGYILSTRDNNAGTVVNNKTTIFTKISEDGKIEWRSQVPEANAIRAIKGTADGGFAFGKYEEQSNDYKLVKYEKGIETVNSVNNIKLDWISEHLDNIGPKQISSYYSDMLVTSSGDYVAVGFGNLGEAIVNKYNKNGELIWNTTLGSGTVLCEATRVFEDTDGGYIIFTSFGEELENIPKDTDVIKLDKDGNLVWAKEIAGKAFSSHIKINYAKCADGGYSILVPTKTGGKNGYNLIKLNSVCEIEYEKNIILDCTINKITKTSDEGYIFAGYINQNQMDVITASQDNLEDIQIEGTQDAVLIKVDKDLSIEWIKNYSYDFADGDQEFTSVIENKAGDYIVSLNSYPIILTYDKNGVLKKENNLKYPDGKIVENSWYSYVRIQDIVEAQDGGYVLFEYDTLIKCDSDFKIEKFKTYKALTEKNGMSYCEYVGNIYKFIPISDTEYVWVGSSRVGNRQFEDTSNWSDKWFSSGNWKPAIYKISIGDIQNESGGEEEDIVIPKVATIVAYNVAQKFNITTEVQPVIPEGETEPVKGGTISGEGMEPYEEVSYGQGSAKPIVITPDDGFQIDTVTVNGEAIEYTIDSDGVSTLEQFKNVQEDKHVVVTFTNAKSQVIVHHYLDEELQEGEEPTKVAEDEYISKHIGEEYTTSPKTDLEDYEVVQEKLPTNATGTATKEPIEVTYYYKLKEYTYTVNYLEKDTNEVVSPAKTSKPVPLGTEVKAADEVIDVDGYTYDSVSVDSITISHDENVINIYYIRRMDLGYTVNYLEKGTNKVLKDAKQVSNQIFGTEIDSLTEIIDIEGYDYDSLSPAKLTIGLEENVIDIYYTKKLKFSYTVNYLEKGTNEVIHEAKVVPDQIEGTVITSSDEVVDIVGFDYDSVSCDSITISTGENIINIYYIRKTNLSYKVNYLDKETDKPIHEQKVAGGKTFGDVIHTVDEVVTIEGYKYVEADKESLVISEGENVLNLYYARRTDLRYLVYYVDIDTDEEICPYKAVENQTFGNEIKAEDEIIEIEGYDFVKADKDILKIASEINVMTLYYRRKDAKVIVHHYEEGTTNKLSETVTIDGKVFDEYVTKVATDIPIRYELASIPENATGIMTEEDIEVIYYYRVMDAKVTVKYLEKDTNIQLAEPKVVNGKVDEAYAESAIDIENYVFDSDTGNSTGKFTKEPIVVIFYYLQETSVKVEHIDQDTNEILDEFEVPGIVGTEYTATSKDFDGYVLVKKPTVETVTMTKEQILLQYYYIKPESAGVIEKHIDVISGDILFNDVHTGDRGTPYKIDAKTFEGYDLVEDKLPLNSEGVMEKDTITVTYYYIHRSNVTAKYVDRITNKEIEEPENINGHEGDSYSTTRKQIDGYILEKEPENADGTMTKKPIEVIYYYARLTGGVVERHIDAITGAQLVDEEKFEGYEGQAYKTEPENIPYYDLVEDKYPENAEGTMTVEPIIVTYYYVRQTEVNIRYVDKATGEDIVEPINIPGHEGDDYTSESKEFEGYDLIDIPENKAGKMTKEPIEVVYYYLRPAKVIATYLDAETREELAEEELFEAHDGDIYVTENKDIPYYKLTKVPENAEGRMRVDVVKGEDGEEIINDTIYVNYYYEKMIVNMKIDKTIGSIIVNGVEKQINSDLGKVEIYRKELANTNVQVVYNIVVTNNGEIAGKAGLIENIPSGMVMKPDRNLEWQVFETLATLETEEIKPGESKTYKVVMEWLGGENNIGTKENVVQIAAIENEAGFEEKDTTDNKDTADLIVTVGTGDYTYVVGVGITLIMLGAISVVLVSKKKKEE